MSTPEHDLDLDTVARRAAADLHTALAVPVVSRQRVVGLALAVIAMVVAAVGVGIVAVDDGDDETIVADDGPASLRVAPSHMPDGIRLVDVGEGDSSAPPGGPESVTAMMTTWTSVWGIGTASDPFAEAGLGINVLFADGIGIDREQAAEEVGDSGVTIGGAPAELQDLENGTRGLSFVPADGIAVTMSGHGLTDEQLIAAANAVRTEPGSTEPTIDPAVFPAGLELWATIGPTGMLLPRLIGEMGSAGTATSWRSDDGRQVLVGALDHADEAVELVNRFGLGPAAVPVAVGGRPGWQSADGLQVLWRPSAGVLVAVMASGLTAEEVLAIAQSVEPVDDDTWASMQATAEANEGGGSDVAVDSSGVPLDSFRIEGQRPDGRRYAIYVDPQGMLCETLETGNGATTSCNEALAGPQVLHDEGVPVAAYGQAGPGTVEVRADVDGMGLSSQIADAEGSRLWYFDLATAGLSSAPGEAVEYDADGNELRRVPVTLDG